MIGRVTSTKMQKTAVVLIERIAMHPLYKKTYKRSKKYLVDDPIGVKDGDLVEIIKVSPISRNKHWRIIKVVGKNLAEIAEEKLKAQAEKVISEVMPEEKVESRVKNQESSEEVKSQNNTPSTKVGPKVKGISKKEKVKKGKEKSSP